jgi:hypothetical protein
MNDHSVHWMNQFREVIPKLTISELNEMATIISGELWNRDGWLQHWMDESNLRWEDA